MSEVDWKSAHDVVLAHHRETFSQDMAYIEDLKAERDAALALHGDPAGSFDKHMQYMQKNIELQQLLTAADERADVLESALKFYADGDHYSVDDGLNWDSCSGEPYNILWHEDQPWFIEDGSVAKAALKPAEEHPCPVSLDGCDGACKKVEGGCDE